MKLKTVVLQSKLRLTALATRMRVVVGDFLSALLPVDNFSVSDASSKQPRKNKTENLAFTDQMTYVPNKRINEGVVFTDSDTAYFAQDYVVGAPTAQTYSASGGNFSWFMSKVLTETPVLTELIVKALPNKVFTETVNVTDDVNGAATGDDQIVQYFKITSNLAAVSDGVLARAISKVLSDAGAVTDAGAIRMQNYTVDGTYFAEDYVGTSAVFS